MEEVDKEISEMKLSLNARARVVAESYLIAVSDFPSCYSMQNGGIDNNSFSSAHEMSSGGFFFMFVKDVVDHVYHVSI
jgi:ARP2/3 complex 20 kDa subunit (ARPC4)